MTFSIVKAGILALALSLQVDAKYVLDASDNYSGQTFFDKWDFITVSSVVGLSLPNFLKISLGQ